MKFYSIHDGVCLLAETAAQDFFVLKNGTGTWEPATSLGVRYVIAGKEIADDLTADEAAKLAKKLGGTIHNVPKMGAKTADG